MLRRAASLLGGRSPWLRRLPRRTTAVTPLRRHPEARPGHRPSGPLRYLDDVRARGYARMARRIPPARPDGYSTSDGEADAYGDEEDLELDAVGADGEEGAEAWKKWEGYMLDFVSGTDDEEEEEEGEGTEEEGEGTEEEKK